jgi:metallophosphoesterase superfamily enzyme
MTGATEFVWVLGNHDPTPPDGIGGTSTECWRAGPLTFRHEAIRTDGRASGEICGHHHPKARIATRGADVTRPCFVSDGRRLMLPALGAYTGGLDVGDPAISGLFPRGGRVFLLGRDRLFSFAFGPSRPRAMAPGAAKMLL